MIIRWHGHSCFEIFNSLRIVIDPHDGRSIGLKTPHLKADLVLVTHEHFDHNATRIVKGDFKIIRDAGKYRIGDVEIEGIEGYHDKENGARRGKITMYKVKNEGISILHVGDLGHILNEEQADKIGKIDILMTPVGGTYTVDAKEAYENVNILKPKVVIPMHYYVPGLSLALAKVDEFLSLFPRENVQYVGNSIDFTRGELPKETTVWVFSL